MVFGLAGSAAAQDTPRAEVSAGYQFFTGKGENEDEDWENFPAGWYADVAGNLTNTVGIVGQVSGNYKTIDESDGDIDFRIHTFMGGVRASSPGRVRGFGQFLIGGANVKASAGELSASETDLAIQLGGGVNVMSANNVGLRVGVDYLRLFAKDEGELSEGEDVNGFRFVVGVVFGLGAR
jgi:opacity protein-like surface antigen